MLPGVAKDAHSHYLNAENENSVNAKDLSVVKVDDVLSIKVVGNPLPVAIGYSILSSSEVCGNGAKGRFIKMMHIFRDQLWSFGGKIKPNSGFLSNVIKPLKSAQSLQQNEEMNGDDDKEEQKEKNDFDAKFKSLSIDNKLFFGFFSSLLSVSSSSLPINVCDVYQSMHQNDSFKDIDVKQSSFSKLARFAQSTQFGEFITCKQQKSKILIESMNAKRIAKHLLLTLNKIKKESFDAIFDWMQVNWQKIKNEEEIKEEEVNEDFVDILFGGWSKIKQSDSINEAFLSHLSETFSVILSETQSGCEINLQSADDVFRSQFLQTLKVSINPSDLPVSASTLLTRKQLHILKPNFVFSKRNLLKVDLLHDIIASVKQTRWKKSGKFLRDLAKQNIVKLKDFGGSGGELMISSINFSFLTNSFNVDGNLKFFTPEAFEKFAAKIKQLQDEQSGAEIKQNDGDQQETQFNAKHNDTKKRVCIRTMYRANHRLLPIFGEQNISKLHSRNKARTFLWSFVTNQKLISSNKQSVCVNASLFHMLFDSKQFHQKTKKENGRLCGVEVGSTVNRKDLVNLFDEYMQPHSAVILDEDEVPKFRAGYPPKIEVSCDKRQGTKFMTHVQGLEVYGIEPAEFRVTAKKFFAAAVTVSALKGKKAKMRGGGSMKMVSIQGNMVKDSDKKDVPNLLMEHYGIPSQFIDAKTKITKQAKK